MASMFVRTLVWPVFLVCLVAVRRQYSFLAVDVVNLVQDVSRHLLHVLERWVSGKSQRLEQTRTRTFMLQSSNPQRLLSEAWKISHPGICSAADLHLQTCSP